MPIPASVSISDRVMPSENFSTSAPSAKLDSNQTLGLAFDMFYFLKYRLGSSWCQAHSLLGPGGLLSAGAVAHAPGLSSHSQIAFAELLDPAGDPAAPRRKVDGHGKHPPPPPETPKLKLQESGHGCRGFQTGF